MPTRVELLCLLVIAEQTISSEGRGFDQDEQAFVVGAKDEGVWT